jgi:hypothetical protein
MGYGGYSHEAHEEIARARTGKGTQDVFKQRECHPLMNPHGVRARESRDSTAHPATTSIAFALDVTGSMGHIPDQLARTQLPSFMKLLMDCGVTDPQVLFLAVGDATTDRASLQVGQFESAAREMDQWLTWSFLEGGGGPGIQESYELGLYFLAQHTILDSFEKRGRKGYMFMTGDELPYPAVSRHQVDTLLGDKVDEDIPTEQVVAALQRSYHPFFVIPSPDRRARCEARWRELLGDHVLVTERPEDICQVSAGLVALGEGVVSDVDALARLLEKTGLKHDRVAAVVRAVTSFAALHGKSGAPLPPLGAATLPGGPSDR